MAARFSSLRRLTRILLFLVLLYPVLVIALTGLWLVAPPVSALMFGRYATLLPVERQYAPLSAISPNLVAAVLLSEDARFCAHSGVDWEALREVLEDSDEDGPSRGASTIAMQTAKNLFLWPSRSVVRKGMEIPLALWLDFVWSKRRLLEVYLNVAEWGPGGVFGVEAASRRYFGKSAARLTAREAALLAKALPNPILRDPSRPGAGYGRLAGRLAAQLGADGPATRCLAAASAG